MKIKTWMAACGLAVCLLAQPAVTGESFLNGYSFYNVGDMKSALRIWLRLAEQGDIQSQYAVALIYMDGEGVPQDYSEARYWRTRAADQNLVPGSSNAKSMLGEMYELGQGGQIDLVRAHMWYNLFVASIPGSGYTQALAWAKSLRDKVAAQMSPGQIAEAQRLAREWTAAHPKK